ncbi:phosphotransferase [Neobacillus cucumis]|uniref:phosphotransferase n=1 Tax=Neobacillus cucumis TaxID=1740721 RepID=UPI002E1A8136|nr:phosphotransferase [Neobacillus cucumis]
MGLPADIVLGNGSLNEALILKREILYKGMNGRFVERFFLSPSNSYIFKPLTNNDQLGKEVWIHDYILPQFPAIYPKIISYKICDEPELNWMILEDLGTLTHEFNETIGLEVIKWMAWWHSLPIDKLSAVPTTALKPKFEDIITDVCCFKDEFLHQLPELGLERKSIEHVYLLLEKNKRSNRKVLSHGDLHVGNFSIVGDELKILDWEHTHLNMPYWDLYHLIDMSHPLFPKRVTQEHRQQLLKEYVERVTFELESGLFMREYHLFSAVFSIWMIGLIKKDLHASDLKWPEEQLNRQLGETIISLRQCAETLSS